MPSSTAPSRSADTRVAPTTRPDVWTIPGTGQEWCDCGQDHQITRDEVAALYAAAGLTSGDRVPHRVVVRVTQDLWKLQSVCRFFHLNLEDAARTVAGDVQASYPLPDAIDITGLFTKTWQGCPEENCTPSEGDLS